MYGIFIWLQSHWISTCTFSPAALYFSARNAAAFSFSSITAPVRAANSAKMPPLRSNYAGVSNSAIFPSLITIILSKSIIVSKRWAIERTVTFANASRMHSWMRRSFSRSTCAVASSNITQLARRSSARATQTNYFCPADKLSPFIAIWQSNWPG